MGKITNVSKNSEKIVHDTTRGTFIERKFKVFFNVSNFG